MEQINSNVDKFLKYMSRPLSVTALNVVYVSNNITFERADIYRDFILTLNDLITSTYLGDDVTNEEDQINHFNWCWNTTCNALNFSQITFNDNLDIHVYFINFYFDTFYSADKDEEKDNIGNFTELWADIFNYNVEKPRTDLDTFLIVYRLFEKSYKKR
jgi:hypothetical protein